MLPFRDHNSSSSFPVVTVTIIAINVLVFIYQLLLQGADQLNAFFLMWAVVPADITQNPNLQEYLTLFTAMFMHGGFAHIGGNMLYLWIFGDNVEDTLGKFGFIGFYLICGLLATFAQILFDPFSTIPNLGASGAIAGVLGAYLFLFPRARVDALVFRFVTTVPAVIVLGFWFVIQLFYGIASIGTTSTGGGVAYWAHAGGFAAGAVLIVIYAVFNGRNLLEGLRG